MSQLKTKFIEDNAVTDLKMRLRNNLALRARNAADNADIEILKISASDVLQILREMSMQNNKIIDLADPTSGTDAATKQYVDSVAQGLTDPKDACRAATTAALPAVTYDNGTAGVGATLTADANGALPSQDGIALALNDRLLVKNQGAGLQNGIYEVTQIGDGSNPFILTRTTDADESSDVTQGMFCPVAEGAVNGSLGFMVTTPDPITVGSTAITFTQFGETILAGTGLTKTGSTISVDNGDGIGFNGNQVVVLVDDTLTTGTTKISGGVVAGRRTFEEGFTLNGTDITNQYVDLTKVASQDSVQLFPRSGIKQKAAVDFTVSLTGGAGGKTRVTFAGDLATGGSAALESGDIIDIAFESLDY